MSRVARLSDFLPLFTPRQECSGYTVTLLDISFPSAQITVYGGCVLRSLLAIEAPVRHGNNCKRGFSDITQERISHSLLTADCADARSCSTSVTLF